MMRAAGGLVAGGLGAYGLTTEAWRSSGVFLAVADTVGMPLLRSVDAEVAHRAAVVAAKMGLTPIDAHCDSYDRLRTRVLGIDMSSPVGLAAGFDKDAEGIVALLDMGFAAVEVGVQERSAWDSARAAEGQSWMPSLPRKAGSMGTTCIANSLCLLTHGFSPLHPPPSTIHTRTLTHTHSHTHTQTHPHTHTPDRECHAAATAR